MINNDLGVMLMTLATTLIGTFFVVFDKNKTNKHENLHLITVMLSGSHMAWMCFAILTDCRLTVDSAISTALFIVGSLAAMVASGRVDEAKSRAQRREWVEAHLPGKLMPIPCMGPVTELLYTSLPVPVQPTREYIMAVTELQTAVNQH